MTKVSLTDDLKRKALQQYHPYVVIDLWSLAQEESLSEEIIIQDVVNLKIIESDIEELLSVSEYMLSQYQKYISNDYDNVIFTPIDDLNTIIHYEYYNGVFYLELPRFYNQICLHIVTKYFDATDDIILFTTEDICDYVNNFSEETWFATNSVTRSNDKIDIIESDGIGRYLVPLPSSLKHLSSIEIDVFYKYTTDNIEKTSIGIIDSYNRGYEDIAVTYEQQRTLIENNSNLDDSTNQIISAQRNAEFELTNDNGIIYSNEEESENTFQLSHNHQKDNKYEMIIKYINDTLYVEEYNQRNNSVDRVAELQTNNTYNYTVETWTE